MAVIESGAADHEAKPKADKEKQKNTHGSHGVVDA